MDEIAKIAQAVLYEGYLLWPYRRSTLKNQRRWTFGGVFPRAYSEAGRPDDAWLMRTECLFEARRGCEIEVRIRFLQVVERRVARSQAGTMEFVDELAIGPLRYLAWEEAVEREVVVRGLTMTDLIRGHVQPIVIRAGGQQEWLPDPSGARVGALIRSWRALQGKLEIHQEALGGGVHRLHVQISNTTPWEGGERAAVLHQTFCSTHTILHATSGVFFSLTDPPDEVRAAAQACRNVGTWPVLVGAPGAHTTLLSSPIILPDYPEIAPESPGDLFDGGEIDQLLILSILSLTEEEKAEMRASDPRAREILDRCSALSEEELARLHGAVREFRPLISE